MTQMFSKASPPVPAPTPPPNMPDPFSPSSLEAARKTMAANTGSRQSTILTTQASRAAGTLAGGFNSGVLGAK